MKPPVLILGCPRSGTTFLASLLKSSTFGEPFETHFIIKYFHKLSFYGDLNGYQNFSRLVKDILCERAIMQHKLKLDLQEMFANMPQKTYAAIIHEICHNIAVLRGKNVESWGEKTPSYTLHVEILLQLFPDSKVIYITRDGRDVALSLMKKSWGPGNVYSCAKLWKEYIQKKDVLFKLAQPGNIYTLTYEHLVDHVEQEIRNIYEFLGESANQAEIEVLSQQVKKGNYHKWQKNMRERERKIFESVAAETLKAEGYEARYQERTINQILAMSYVFHDKVKLIANLIKLNIFDSIAIKFFNKEAFNE